jgi:hypothetical protein
VLGAPAARAPRACAHSSTRVCASVCRAERARETPPTPAAAYQDLEQLIAGVLTTPLRRQQRRGVRERVWRRMWHGVGAVFFMLVFLSLFPPRVVF